MEQTPSPLSDGIFTQDEVQILERDHIFHPRQTAGKRKVSAALLSPPESVTGSVASGSSQVSASVRLSPENTLRCDTFDLPTHPESIEALEFIGYEQSTASEIYDLFITRPDPEQCPDTLLTYATARANALRNERFSALPPAEAMTKLGFKIEIQNALLDPEFADILWTEDLTFWLRNTLKMRYESLLRLQDRLKAHVAVHGGRKKDMKKAKRASLQGVFPQAAPSNQKEEEAAPDVTATINSMTQVHRLPASRISLVTEDTPEILPNHSMLYIGKSVEEMYPPGQWIREDGSLDIVVLMSDPRGDFNYHSRCHYWTTDRQVAEVYRLWAVRRNQYCESWLICVQVPTAFLFALNTTELWFSPEWKEFVWHCKSGRRPPPNFDTMLEAELIRGHICTGRDVSIRTIQQHDIQEKITDDNVLRVGRSKTKATQWVFLTEDCITRLGEEIRGKVHINIFEPAAK